MSETDYQLHPAHVEATYPSPTWNRPILYTDTTNGGKQPLRDDLWAITTNELNALWAIALNTQDTVRNGKPHDFPALLAALDEAVKEEEVQE